MKEQSQDLTFVRCSCGVVFQEEIKERELSELYLGQYKQKKFYDDSAAYPVTAYFPLIEEMTYGRRLLEIDSLDLGISKAAADRGWVTFATSSEKHEKTHILEDKFINLKEVPELKFDCIVAYHYIEKRVDGEVLKKFREWLNPGGVLFIATPDTHYLDEVGFVNFGHWFPDNNVMFSKPMLKRELEKAMFDVIMMRSNPSTRFIKNNDIHCIAQRGM